MPRHPMERASRGSEAETSSRGCRGYSPLSGLAMGFGPSGRTPGALFSFCRGCSGDCRGPNTKKARRSEPLLSLDAISRGECCHTSCVIHKPKGSHERTHRRIGAGRGKRPILSCLSSPETIPRNASLSAPRNNGRGNNSSRRLPRPDLSN